MDNIMDYTKFTINHINRKTSEDFLKSRHYLALQGRSFRSGRNFGLCLGDELIGVAIFHGVSAGETIKGAFGLEKTEQAGFYELGRLALDADNNEKNLASWFLAQCIKLLRKETNVRAIITYADSSLHYGSIYQALNFKYYGLTTKKKDFYVKQEDGSYKLQTRGKTVGVDGEWRPRTQKHRYMIVYDKSLTVRWKEQPYPKAATPPSTTP